MFLIPVVILIVIAIILYSYYRKVYALKKVKKTLELIGCQVEEVKKNKAYHFIAKKADKLYLIKVVFFFCQDEINVNAKNFWQVNHGVVSSRKKGEKMPNVYDLVNLDLKANGFEKDTIKLYIIYPKATTLMKVINECEMVLIKPSVDCHSAKLGNYTSLMDEFDLF